MKGETIFGCLPSRRGKNWLKASNTQVLQLAGVGGKLPEGEQREAGVDVPEKGANYSWGPTGVWWKERWAGKKEVGV